MKIHYHPKLKSFAGELRKSGTLAEVLLWKELRGRKMYGCRFLRQKPIGNYVVDFYCPTLKLAVEIDGSSHDAKMEKDENRQKELQRLGISFLRFTESDMRRSPDSVMRAIREKVTPLLAADGECSPF